MHFRFASVSVVALSNIAPCRFAPERFAPVRFALDRFAPVRFAVERFTCDILVYDKSENAKLAHSLTDHYCNRIILFMTN